MNPWELESYRRVPELKKTIDALKESLKRAEDELYQIQSVCSHDWENKYTPKYNVAYTIPGDPPGTMGVDWRGPTHVPAKTTPMWTRTCKKCGKVETTTRTTSEEVEHPKW